jgi:hypothetical protein
MPPAVACLNVREDLTLGGVVALYSIEMVYRAPRPDRKGTNPSSCGNVTRAVCHLLRPHPHCGSSGSDPRLLSLMDRKGLQHCRQRHLLDVPLGNRLDDREGQQRQPQRIADLGPIQLLGPRDIGDRGVRPSVQQPLPPERSPQRLQQRRIRIGGHVPRRGGQHNPVRRYRRIPPASIADRQGRITASNTSAGGRGYAGDLQCWRSCRHSPVPVPIECVFEAVIAPE